MLVFWFIKFVMLMLDVGYVFKLKHILIIDQLNNQ